MSKAEGFKGRGVEVSAKEIHEGVISTKQTSRQHTMGDCSICYQFSQSITCVLNEAWPPLYMCSSIYGHHDQNLNESTELLY